MKFTKELAVNVGLSFVSGFITSLSAFTAATAKPPAFAVAVSALGAAVYAGVRGAIGFLALNAKSVPAIPVDE